MKKQILLPLVTICLQFISSCNAPSSTETTTQNTVTSQVDESQQIKSNSTLKLSFDFNGESFKNDATAPNQLKGMNQSEGKWLIAFSGIAGEEPKQVDIQLNVEKFNLEVGKLQINSSSVSLMGFENTDPTELLFTSSGNVSLEITSINKINNNNPSMDEYLVNGLFNGEFKNVTGSKTVKVENGRFENYVLVSIK